MEDNMDKRIISERKEFFSSDIADVWDIITNVYDSSWRSDIKKTVASHDGKSFVEVTEKNFETTFIVAQKVKNQCFELTFKNKNMHGRFFSEYKEVGSGCEVTFTETVFLNNFFMKLLAIPYLKAQQKKYCKDIKKALNEI